MQPVVKWVGGKRQLLEKIISYMPKTFNTYYEPFIGGGAVLFSIEPQKAVINDFNSELINMYQVIRSTDGYKELMEILDFHEDNHSKDYYYQIRDLDRLDTYKNLTTVQRAARMIYLNKSGFNGLYRVNKKGYFNVPFNKKETISLYKKDNIDLVHKYLAESNIELLNKDFIEATKTAKKDDFVYFDPPYDVLDNKASFTAYTKSDFNREDQKRLKELVDDLTSRGVKVMLSNHYTDFIVDLYKDYTIHIVSAKRLVNSDASGRGNVKEVIITNYEK